MKLTVQWQATLLMAVASTALLASAGLSHGQDSLAFAEHKIKAIYLYNFLQFVRWPNSAEASDQESQSKDEGKTLTIGIIGEDPFDKHFDAVEGKPVESTGKILRIKRFGSYKRELPLEDCQLLFISSSERKNVARILADVKDSQVLTVADRADFLEQGGMINLVLIKDRIRWEINQVAVQSAGLQISSQLTRVAVRNITKTDSASE